MCKRGCSYLPCSPPRAPKQSLAGACQPNCCRAELEGSRPTGRREQPLGPSSLCRSCRGNTAPGRCSVVAHVALPKKAWPISVASGAAALSRGLAGQSGLCVVFKLRHGPDGGVNFVPSMLPIARGYWKCVSAGRGPKNDIGKKNNCPCCCCCVLDCLFDSSYCLVHEIRGHSDVVAAARLQPDSAEFYSAVRSLAADFGAHNLADSIHLRCVVASRKLRRHYMNTSIGSS